MSRSHLSSKLWRAAIASAVASAAIIVTGCSQEEQPQAYGATSSRDNGTVAQASSTARAQPSGQSDVSMAFPTGNRDTSDLMVEQMGASEVRVGQPYSYQLRVTNLKNQPLTGVVLRQRLPGDFKLISNDAASAPEENGQARINIGNLGPRESKTIQMSGTPGKVGTLDTCVSASYNPPTLCSHVAVVAPAIQAVAEGPSQVDICQNLVYRYRVTNTGTGTAHNVVLQENLPEGLQSAKGQREITENVGDLAQGQSKDVRIQLKPNRAGHYTSQAIVRSSDAGQAETPKITTTVLAPKLAVTVSGPKEQYLGQPLSYQVTVKNNGDAPSAQTRVRLGATPGHVQFVSAQGADGTNLSSEQAGGGQDLGTIAPGESHTATVNFTSLQGGPVAVEATVQAPCAQPVSTSVNTNIMTLTASALVVTHNPDPVLIGSNVTYDIIVQNKGTATDHDVHVLAKLPDGEQFVKASGQSEATNEGQNVTFAPIETLAPKQTLTWHVVAKALRAGDVEFQATMTSKATPKAAVKIEPTKLYGVQGGNETHTNEAKNPEPITPPTPTPPPAESPDQNK